MLATARRAAGFLANERASGFGSALRALERAARRNLSLQRKRGSILMRINPVPIFTKIIDLDLTREETAARARIGKDTLRKIEAGRMVSLKSVRRLCLC